MKDTKDTVLQDEEIIGLSPRHYAPEEIDNAFFVDSGNAFTEDHFRELEKSFERFSRNY